MSLQSIETGVETAAETTLTAGEALIAPAVTDFKLLIANRVGDVLVAALVLIGVAVGHAI